MNVQPCARCGYGVYPAEKINCIDQVSSLSLSFWTIINAQIGTSNAVQISRFQKFFTHNWVQNWKELITRVYLKEKIVKFIKWMVRISTEILNLAD